MSCLCLTGPVKTNSVWYLVPFVGVMGGALFLGEWSDYSISYIVVQCVGEDLSDISTRQLTRCRCLLAGCVVICVGLYLTMVPRAAAAKSAGVRQEMARSPSSSRSVSHALSGSLQSPALAGLPIPAADSPAPRTLSSEQLGQWGFSVRGVLASPPIAVASSQTNIETRVSESETAATATSTSPGLSKFVMGGADTLPPRAFR